MPKMISRGYDEDKTLALIVQWFEGPITQTNLQQLADMRAAIAYDLQQAVRVGNGPRISALRDALEDMNS